MDVPSLDELQMILLKKKLIKGQASFSKENVPSQDLFPRKNFPTTEVVEVESSTRDLPNRDINVSGHKRSSPAGKTLSPKK